jgi:hypothetical protein
MAAKQHTETVITIKAPRIRTVRLHLAGTAPYVQARFSQKAMAMMAEKMVAGSTARGKKAREPRDFDNDFEQAKHISTEGWCGIPAGAFRAAAISACRLVGFKMTLAKLSIFILADGIDAVDGVPLVKIEGTPEPMRMHTRNATGVADLRVRPMWREWGCKLNVRYDAEQFVPDDVVNLFSRVGMQVGIGEGRPDSRASAGLGWGTFEITEVHGEQ